MPKRWRTAKVIGIKPMNKRTYQLSIQVEGDAMLDFKPGQFITFDLPIGEKRLDRWRSYSIASSGMNNANIIDLCIGYLKGGSASEYFFNVLKAGDELTLKGPEGQFILPEDLSEIELVMVCTGTGVAPFRSMINYIYNNNIPHKRVHLIFGSRYKEDILYEEEFERLAKAHDTFNYDVCLSREEDWVGHKGYVHAVYEDTYKEIDAKRVFMLCGWSQMVDEAIGRLTKLGYSKENMRVELYG